MSAARELRSVAMIVVHDWDCRCSACGYGAWQSMWGKKAEIITQTSTVCPNCGAVFTGRRLSEEARRPAPGYLGDR